MKKKKKIHKKEMKIIEIQDKILKMNHVKK